MKQLLRFPAALLAASVFTLASQLVAADDTSPLQAQERTLPNGLRVLIERDSRQPRVAVAIAYDAGARDDPPGYRGLAHLVEHMTYRGSRHAPEREGVRRLLAAGGLFNGFTSHEHTAYISVLPSDQLPLALWLESERMAFSTETMTDDQLDTELDVVRSEWVERGAEWAGARLPEVQAHELFSEGHPYRSVDDAGSPDDFSFDLDHVRWFHQQHYRPENATLAIVGDVDLREANALVDKYFADVRAQGTRATRPAITFAPFTGERVVRFEWRHDRPLLLVRYRIACPDLACKQALRLLATHAAADRLSPVRHALQSEARIASRVAMDVIDYGPAQELIIAVTLAPDAGLSPAQRVLDDALRALSVLPIDERDLTSVKQAVWTSETRDAEALDRRAVRYATSGRGQSERYDLDAIQAAIFGVTSAQLTGLASDLFSNRKRLIVRVSSDDLALPRGEVVGASGSLFGGAQ